MKKKWHWRPPLLASSCQQPTKLYGCYLIPRTGGHQGFILVTLRPLSFCAGVFDELHPKFYYSTFIALANLTGATYIYLFSYRSRCMYVVCMMLREVNMEMVQVNALPRTQQEQSGVKSI